MDKVRLGRALGYGARHAAKTLASAVDAATSPDPRAVSPRPPAGRPVAAQSVTARATEIHQSVVAVQQQARGQARTLGRSFWTPLKNFSSAIWLQVTGTFFAVFALLMGEGVWRLRGSLHAAPSSPEAHKLWFHAAVFLGFAYFALSNFVKAALRERR